MFSVARFGLIAASICAAAVAIAQPSASALGAAPSAVGAASQTAGALSAQRDTDERSAAESAIAGADWKTAEAKLGAWLGSHPADARALFDAGFVADAQNRFDQAAALYRRAIAADPKSFEAHLSLGLLLAQQKKLDEARPELEIATNLDPGDAGQALKARAWRALARIDRDTDPAAASSELLQALKLSPETPADTLLSAELAEKTGQNVDAEAAYRRVLTEEPDSATAAAGLAHLLIVRKQFGDAEALLRASLAKNPDDPTLTAQLATVLADQDKAEALPLLQRLHAAHPADPSISRMLAEVLADAGDYAGSDRLYTGLLNSHPDDAGLLVAHGQNLVRQTHFADAFTVFDKATQIDASNTDAWSGLAFTASRTGRPDVALHALAIRSRYLPENASTFFLWAISYDSLHQKTQAAAYYHRFLDTAGGKLPNQEWQARRRLEVLEKQGQTAR